MPDPVLLTDESVLRSRQWIVGSSSRSQPLSPPFFYEVLLLLYLSIRWSQKLSANFPLEAIGQILLTVVVVVYVVRCVFARSQRLPSGIEVRNCKDGVGTASAALLGPMCAAALLVGSQVVNESSSDFFRHVYWTTYCVGVDFVANALLSNGRDQLYCIVPFGGAILSAIAIRRKILHVETFSALGAYFLAVRWLLKHWTRCFTTCEASLVSTSASLLFVRIVLSVLNIYPVVSSGNEFTEIITSGALLATLLLGAFAITSALTLRYNFEKKSDRIKLSTMSGAILLAGALTYLYVWTAFKNTDEPLQWLFKYVVHSKLHLGLCMFWIVLLSFPLIFFPPHTLGVSPIVARKLYHVLAMLMFMPAILVDVSFLRIGLAGSLAAMILIEALRISTIQPLSEKIESVTAPLLDSRDEGVVVLTHMYLLIGCALPLWMTRLAGLPEQGVAAAAGVICLGVSDSVAAAIGSAYGRWRWPGTRKTVEGTVAGFVAGVLSSVCWYCLTTSRTSVPLSGICSATAIAVLYESFTSQIDNLVLPLVFFNALILRNVL